MVGDSSLEPEEDGKKNNPTKAGVQGGCRCFCRDWLLGNQHDFLGANSSGRMLNKDSCVSDVHVIICPY